MNRFRLYSVVAVVFLALGAWAADGGIGKLSIVTTPSARIYIDGKPMGRSPLHALKITPGRHRVTYESKAKGTRMELDVLIRAGKHLECSYNFDTGEQNCAEERPPAPAAKKVTTTMDLLSEPSSDVYVDDQWIGTTPVRKHEVQEGTHRVEFRHPDYEPLARDVEVKSGQSVEVQVKFSTVRKEESPQDSKPEEP